jgi:hypothetical protein
MLSYNVGHDQDTQLYEHNLLAMDKRVLTTLGKGLHT